jgi:hypothetical protein
VRHHDIRERLHPLNQTVYQPVKGVTAAEATNKDGV